MLPPSLSGGRVRWSSGFVGRVTGNRSDGPVVYRASAFGSVGLGFDSESGQTNDLKIGFHCFPA